MTRQSLFLRLVRRVRGVGGLSQYQRAALARALVWVPVTRVALFVIPWRRVSETFEKGPARPDVPDWPNAKATVWAVEAVAKRLLWDRPCLTQALVARRLLRHYGVETDLRLGAARRDDGGFQAHAWLEREGAIVIGGRASGAVYAPFRPVAPTRRRQAGASAT